MATLAPLAGHLQPVISQGVTLLFPMPALLNTIPAGMPLPINLVQVARGYLNAITFLAAAAPQDLQNMQDYIRATEELFMMTAIENAVANGLALALAPAIALALPPAVAAGIAAGHAEVHAKRRNGMATRMSDALFPYSQFGQGPVPAEFPGTVRALLALTGPNLIVLEQYYFIAQAGTVADRREMFAREIGCPFPF